MGRRGQFEGFIADWGIPLLLLILIITGIYLVYSGKLRALIDFFIQWKRYG